MSRLRCIRNTGILLVIVEVASFRRPALKTRKRDRPEVCIMAFSMDHHAQGSQANAPSAPNQSVAPQQMIQPLSAPTKPTVMDKGRDRSRCRASANAPV